MQFEKYHKIHRLGKEEVEGILEGSCFVQEKVDGANTTVWLKDDGTFGCGSRNRELGDESFNGFKEYIYGHLGIQNCLRENPEYRLYGEWLVRHTIPYKETAYKKFYLFDIRVGEKFLPIDEVHAIAIEYNIETPKLFGIFENPTKEKLKELVGQSDICEKGEGVVIKNFGFINKFGRIEYAKLVAEEFMEDNAIVFGGNNKHADSYWEMYVVNKYITVQRVKKVMDKLQPEINEKLDMKHIPRITNTVYHDMLTEEIWEIQKKARKIDFNNLKRLANKKAKQVYVDILNDDISIFDK